MKRYYLILAVIGLIFLGACREEEPVPTPIEERSVAAAEPTATQEPTAAPTETPEPEPTASTKICCFPMTCFPSVTA